MNQPFIILLPITQTRAASARAVRRQQIREWAVFGPRPSLEASYAMALGQFHLLESACGLKVEADDLGKG